MSKRYALMRIPLYMRGRDFRSLGEMDAYPMLYFDTKKEAEAAQELITSFVTNPPRPMQAVYKHHFVVKVDA